MEQKMMDIEILEAELAEAKAKREQARLEIEAKQKPAKIKAEIERINRMTANDAVFDELVSEHGVNALRRIDTDDGHMIVVKRPASIAFKKFQQSRTTVDDCDALVRTCLVHPKREEYNAIVADWPAKIVECANAASELAGVRKRELEGK